MEIVRVKMLVSKDQLIKDECYNLAPNVADSLIKDGKAVKVPDSEGQLPSETKVVAPSETKPAAAATAKQPAKADPNIIKEKRP